MAHWHREALRAVVRAGARTVPLDELLAREAGDDAEGAEPLAEVPW